MVQNCDGATKPMPRQPILTPFGADVREIHLASAPLARVICQVTFPIIASIETEGFVGPFQERIRDEFPRLHAEQSAGLLIGSGELRPQMGNHVWRFKNLSGDWQVSLAKNFVALDTTAYVSRSDFLRRLGTVLAALGDRIHPATIERVGLRYVDRIERAEPSDVARLIRAELVGMAAVEWGSSDAELKHTISDAQFSVGSAELRARWGLLPANATLDPFVEAVETRSWLLDLDMFQLGEHEFGATTITAQVEGFARAIYRFFRWVVTDEFLSRYGAEE